MQGDGSVVGRVECTDLDGGSADDRKSVVGYRPNVCVHVTRGAWHQSALIT